MINLGIKRFAKLGRGYPSILRVFLQIRKLNVEDWLQVEFIFQKLNTSKGLDNFKYDFLDLKAFRGYRKNFWISCH